MPRYKKKTTTAVAPPAQEDEQVAMETEQEPASEEVPQTPTVSRHFNPEEYGDVEIPAAPESVATYDVNGPRLMISQIKNHNFKSYAGTQTLGPFHKSFTSIVGPNGSGKSNVIDSMLFVFGYRANKIRSKKLSVLLHNSEEHRDINSCTVSVYFQRIIDTGPGDEDFTVVPDSELVVSRTAYKDNTSNYSVDGRKVTYKEVAALLRKCGIDLDHNRFLILQGEVEQIAMMKPKALTEHEDGMLEFLEDIIGSNRFKEPIDILSKRVETLNEYRAEKLNRVKVVEKEKDDLEGPKNEALEFLKQENELIGVKHQLYHVYIHECTENEEKAKAEFDKINESLKEVDNKMAEITETKKVKAEEHKKTFKEFQELQKEIEINKDKYNEFEQKDVKCREDLKHTKAQIKKQEATLVAETKKIEELKAVPAKSEKLVEELTVKLEKLESEKIQAEESVKKVMDSLKTETMELQVEKDKKEEKVLELCQSVNEAKSKYQIAQSELDVYLSNQTREENKLKETSEKLETLEETLKTRKTNIIEMETRIPELQKIVSKCKQDFKQVEEKEAKSTQTVRELRAKLEATRSSMQADLNKGKVIQALMEQKRLGKISGIHGRLGDLGGIDKEYDVAISTACGSLDNIVVDTISTAQKCVDFLKKADVGVATFIGLDKMQRLNDQANRKIKTPENVPRLFDLVKVKDPAFLPAFYYALRDTLVAQDLNQGTRIAYGKTRYRVVTLAGQVIDVAGTLSGGGSKVSKGRMGSAAVTDVDPKQLTAIEKSLEKATVEPEEYHVF
ncbi:structural maintenance of chromosomes protein 4 [Patella vulgata]|uniref:structural maintenance of chromosomes protein 4 n=1 Tax=Patella vulgata TaxID=6465 RepID=UPI0024A9F229|nr:structural maintenance of chromosomes protein 4 [Patella vulgata]